MGRCCDAAIREHVAEELVHAWPRRRRILVLPEQDLTFAADGLVTGKALHEGWAIGQLVEAGAAALQGAEEQAEEGEVVAAAVGEGGERAFGPAQQNERAALHGEAGVGADRRAERRSEEH